MSSTTAERDKMVSMRATSAEWNLIDRAAAAAGKSRTTFVLEAAKRQAEDTLKDRTAFTFAAKDWRDLAATLDAPVSKAERAKVARLLAETPAWNRK